MKYSDFVKSVTEAKVHRVSEFDKEIAFKTEQATYLLSTSGSQSKKYYLHSIDRIKEGVESFLDTHPLNKDDRWWVSLSTKHVAGFSILARSYFSEARDPYEAPFSLDSGVIDEEGITVLSLVPTQVYDLVFKNFKAPSCIKYVFVGGAPLSDELFFKAKSLGWPLVPCFGSTETMAQFSSSKDNKSYNIYSGWGIKVSSSNSLEIKGPSVFSHRVLMSGEVLENKDDWIDLKDQVEIINQSFVFKGRLDNRYKSKGSYRDFSLQKKNLESLMLEKGFDLKEAFLVVLEEERSGAGVYLITSNIECAKLLETQFQELRGSFLVEDLSILRNEIGKPIKTKIEDVLLRPLLLV